jgi:hypothetical protein
MSDFIKKMEKYPPHITSAISIFIIVILIIGIWGYFSYDKEENERNTKLQRDICFAEAERTYNEFLEKHAKQKDGSYSMPMHQWTFIENQTKDTKDVCLKKYPITRD